MLGAGETRQGKRNMADRTQTQKHDITRILANKDLLVTTLSIARQMNRDRELGLTRGLLAVKRVEKTLQNVIQKGITRALSRQEKSKATFKVKHETTGQPVNFNVVSDFPMPEKLKKMLSTSFANYADTLVQDASRDIVSNDLYDKRARGKRRQSGPVTTATLNSASNQFESQLEHQINEYNSFYEANRETLTTLTRQDVLDIIEFFQTSNMVADVGKPANTLVALEIFILGYLKHHAKLNINNWSFSDEELRFMEKLYEIKASAHGSGLNAVGQVLKALDPYETIKQRMLDDYNIHEEDLEPFFAAVDALQATTTKADKDVWEERVAIQLDRVEKMMAENDLRPKGFGKNWWQKLKAARYTFMLSGPVTWVRNIISNVAVENLNKAADVVGGLVFSKKKVCPYSMGLTQGTD